MFTIVEKKKMQTAIFLFTFKHVFTSYKYLFVFAIYYEKKNVYAEDEKK